MKLRIKSMIWNTRKQKTNLQNKEKESKNMRVAQTASGTTLREPTFTSWGCHKEKRKSKKLEMYLEM